MAQTLNIEQKLADLLDTRDFDPEMLDARGQPADAGEAKIFKFDYVGSSGQNYGTMVIVLGNDNEMFIMYGDNLGKTIEDPNDREEFFQFQQQLSDLANRNRWVATKMNITKLKRVAAGIAAIKEGLFEGYYGTRKVSYAGEPTQARLMIKHNRSLGENDARYRYVESIFIETADGERFKLPFTYMTGAKAMLEHVRQGGKPYDIRGTHICEMVTELKLLNRFNRATAHRVTEGVSQQLVEQAQNYYQSLKESLHRLSSSRGYTAYFEQWHPLDDSQEENLVEDIKTLFVEQTIDTRIEEALPLLAKIQQGSKMKEADIFESWANRLVEGTWALPETPEQLDKLKTLMSQELIVGPDAINATEQLSDIVGDDILFDRLAELARQSQGRANVWDDSEVMERLQELGIDTSAVAQPSTEPVAPEADTTEPQPPVSESRIIDESGETLEHILDRFKHEVQQFEETGELDTDLYDALFDYYANTGEMPYGTMKARTGDPYEWISRQLDKDLGIAEADATHTFETDISEFMGEGSCNHTMEGEYCPEHGLMECGTVAGAVAPVMGEQEELDEISADPKYLHAAERSRSIARDTQRMSGKSPEEKAAARRTELKRDAGIAGYTKRHKAAHPEMYPKVTPKPAPKLRDPSTEYSDDYSVWAAGRRDTVDESSKDDPMNYNAAITSSYYESADPLARIKELALRK